MSCLQDDAAKGKIRRIRNHFWCPFLVRRTLNYIWENGLIQSYVKKANVAAGGFFASLVLSIFAEAPDSVLFKVAILGVGYCMIAACGFYLKAKGRSLFWLLLLPFTVIALIVFYCLGDQSRMGQEIKCPSCNKVNFNAQDACRYCKSPLPGGGGGAPLGPNAA